MDVLTVLSSNVTETSKYSQFDAPLLSLKETISIRREFLPSSCLTHFERDPFQLDRALMQYMFDKDGRRFLDCCTSTSPVGHCHPAVVRAVTTRSASLFTGFPNITLSDELAQYPEQLVRLSPDHLDTAMFTSSGSEAVDLALRVARAVSGQSDVVVVDHSFHGSWSSTIDRSPLDLRRAGKKIPEWLHIVPLPWSRDLSAGSSHDADIAELFFQQAKTVVESAVARGRKISCFLCEPVFTAAGVYFPPDGWLSKMTKLMRSLGALVIIDAVGTGLGRSGDSFWGFEHCNIEPDIVCSGKSIGNGFPMAVTLFKKHIVEQAGSLSLAKNYRPSPLVCAIGAAVLQVMNQENLMENARLVGAHLLRSLKQLMIRWDCIGDVRGRGLLIGVEFVQSKQCFTPAPDICTSVVYRLKEIHDVITACEGRDRNVLYITPPLCFSREDADRLVRALDSVLIDVDQYGTHVKTSELVLDITAKELESEVYRSLYEDID